MVGKATVENGALLSAENHTWFHQQSKEAQAEMNKKFQEYKKCVVVIEDFEIPFELITSEIVIDPKGKIIREKARREEKKEMQRLKKIYEDR